MDGREIKIFPDAGEYDGIPNINYDLVPVSKYVKDGDVIRVVGNADQLSYTRFGMIKVGSNNYMMVQGQETPLSDMPTSSGTLVYRGHAVYLDNANPVNAGTANFYVNFGNRTFRGDMSFPDVRGGIQLDNGTINGNGFSGTSSQGAEFKGSFHGPNAEELGGVYRKQGEYDGAFGAKR